MSASKNTFTHNQVVKLTFNKDQWQLIDKIFVGVLFVLIIFEILNKNLLKSK